MCSLGARQQCRSAYLIVGKTVIWDTEIWDGLGLIWDNSSNLKILVVGKSDSLALLW